MALSDNSPCGAGAAIHPLRSPNLSRRLLELAMAAGPGVRMILNMQGVDYIDSTGLGAMVMCSTRVRNARGVAKLVLVNINLRNIKCWS